MRSKKGPRKETGKSSGFATLATDLVGESCDLRARGAIGRECGALERAQDELEYAEHHEAQACDQLQVIHPRHAVRPSERLHANGAA